MVCSFSEYTNSKLMSIFTGKFDPQNSFSLELWGTEGYREPRYTLTVVDSPPFKDQNGLYAIFIVPHGKFQSVTHSLVHSLTHSLSNSLTHNTHSFIHSLTHSLSNSLTHNTHSLTYSPKD